ncbi:alpha/beta fold hydrolase [Pseudonocardia adelaidensis]|uniref:alpha/beta fold hydrolase n=1 Tax=Pseudonocardia adelaidensis TaxID=648754 RepID=UPI003CD09A89
MNATAISHRSVDVPGLRVHLAEAGPADGPVVLLLHGFPECWYSWRHQLVALGAAGFHAVAPDQRGYGGTDAPGDVADYTILHLVGDVVGLLDALGRSGPWWWGTTGARRSRGTRRCCAPIACAAPSGCRCRSAAAARLGPPRRWPATSARATTSCTSSPPAWRTPSWRPTRGRRSGGCSRPRPAGRRRCCRWSSRARASWTSCPNRNTSRPGSPRRTWTSTSTSTAAAASPAGSTGTATSTGAGRSPPPGTGHRSPGPPCSWQANRIS